MLLLSSIAATATFFLTGVLTALVLHQSDGPAAAPLDWTLGNSGANLLALQTIPFGVSAFLYKFVRTLEVNLACHILNYPEF